MKKRKISTILLAICLISLSVFACLTLTSCKKDGFIYFVTEEKKKGPQFLEGALADIRVNDTIVLSEYIEYVEEEYSIKITDENGNEQDVTDDIIWTTDKPGKYVITYTVKKGKSKGTSTFVLNVTYPLLEWSFTIQNEAYNFGDEIIFSKYFGDMNISTSLANCKIIMDSVEVDGNIIDLTNETSYVINSMSNHTFSFHAEAADGQRCEGREVISVKYINEEYANYLANDLNVSLYGDLCVDEGNFTMVSGSYANGNNIWLRREAGGHKLPYLAYNGEYGIDDYVKIDFTGNNMPILSFFRDNEYSRSVFDGTKGVVYTGGFTDNSGNPIHSEMCSRGTLYGPYMLHEYDRGATDTTTIGTTSGNADTPYPGSLKSLQEGTRYRMIAGFSGVRLGKANKLNTTTPADTIFLDFSCVIIDLDAREVFSKFTISSYGIQALGFEEISIDVEDNEFLKGNIVLYGNHGKQTKFDKIYPIITGTTFEQICIEELTFSSFKEGAESFILQDGATVEVSDYADVTLPNSLFYYRDEEGNIVNVESDVFTLENGSYVLYYSDGENLCATLPLTVNSYSQKVNSWITSDNVKLYGVEEISDDLSVTLKAGKLGNGGQYKGENPGNRIDQGYLAFDGNYDFDDFVAFDFTGKNMPEVAFFAKNYNNSMYYQDGGKQGIVFTSGVTLADGKVNDDETFLGASKQVHIDSPFMIQDLTSNWLAEGSQVESALARANLIDGVHYRVILGYTYEEILIGGKVDRTVPVVNWYLYNLDQKEVVEEGRIACWNFFTGKENRVDYMTTKDLVGSIVLYGKFGTTLKLDKVHGVFENSTIETVAAGLNSNTTYTVNFTDEKGNVLSTVNNVKFGEKVVFNGAIPTPSITEDSAFTYSYVWDKPFGKISANTTYSLRVVATPKETVKTHGVNFDGPDVVFTKGNLGNGANYAIGQNNDDYDDKPSFVTQSYLAIDGNYSFDDYIVIEFTGKNMPEVMFFAKNYDDSMYYSQGKQGVVVSSGITLWNGSLGTAQANNRQIGVSGPFGAYNQAAGAPHGGNMMLDFNSSLARANLEDGIRYRVIMGITRGENEQSFTLQYLLYDLTNGEEVERISQTTWNFFTGTDAKVGNMTLDDLVGSIVLYGKFGVENTLDRIYGVFENTTIDAVVSQLN